LLLALAPACGDDDSETGGDTGADAGDDLPPSVTFALRIQTHGSAFVAPHYARSWGVWNIPYHQTLDLALSDTPLTLEPVADVRVALERSDGTPLGEVDSDADGLVVFELSADLWPESVTVSATAYKSGYVMHSATDIARPASDEPLDFRIYPLWEEPDQMVQVAGIVVHRHQGAYLAVESTAPCSTEFLQLSDTWAIQVPANIPFDLIVADVIRQEVSDWDRDTEFFHLARISSEGLEADTLLGEIDLETEAVDPTRFAGSFRLPERGDSPLRQNYASPHLYPFAATSFWSGIVGGDTSWNLDGDRVGYTGELVETPEYGGNWYQLDVSAGSAWSGAFGRGVPEGEQGQLLDVPEWVSEWGHPIEETLIWTLFDEGVRPSVLIRNELEIMWVVDVPEDATQATLPLPPSNVDLATLLGPAPNAMLALERRIDRDEGVIWMEAEGDPLGLGLGD
jgi:hypothetical protein